MINQADKFVNDILLIVGAGIGLYLAAHIVALAVFKARAKVPHRIEQIGDVKHWQIHIDPTTPPHVVNQLLDTIDQVIESRDRQGRKI